MYSQRLKSTFPTSTNILKLLWSLPQNTADTVTALHWKSAREILNLICLLKLCLWTLDSRIALYSQQYMHGSVLGCLSHNPIFCAYNFVTTLFPDCSVSLFTTLYTSCWSLHQSGAGKRSFLPSNPTQSWLLSHFKEPSVTNLSRGSLLFRY